MSILAKALHIAIIASAISSTLIVSAATPATVENISSPQTICDGANVNDYWYVGEVRYPRDHFFGDNNYDWAFGLKSSKVQIYSPSNMLSVTGGFNWRSNGKPQGVNEVIIMQNDGGSQLTSHPSSPNVLAGQIVYQINRLYSYELIWGDFTIWYTDPSYNYTTKTVPDFDSPRIVDNECVNIYARWCGDGLLTNGETCDPAAPGYTPDTCSVTTCTPIAPPPVDGVCDPARTGVQPSPITAGSCTTGSPVGFTFSGTSPINYAWNCTGNNGGSTAACTASYTPPVVPVCNPAKTGTQASPVLSTDTLCNVGTVSAFIPVTIGNKTTYTWSCNASTAVNCSADYTAPTVYPAALALKKYVSGQDAQDNASAVTVASPSVYNYTIIVTNVGSGALVASTTTVTDALPTGVTLTATPSGAGWNCTGTVGATSFSCTRADGLAAGMAFATITVPVTVTAAPGYITNTATVTNPSDSNGPTDNTDPAVIYIPTPVPFDLSIKKYISSGTGVELDAQSGSAVSMNTGSGFNYVIRVKNEGTGATYGVTTVKDILPAGVTLSGTVTGAPWACTASGQTVLCTVSAVIAAGAYFPDIRVPVVTYPIVTVSANPPVSQYIPKDAKAIKVGSINIWSESLTRIDFIDIARTGLGNASSIEKIQLAYSGQAFPATVTPLTGGYRMTFATPLLISGKVTLDLVVSMNATANEQHQFSIVAIQIPTSPMTGMSMAVWTLNTTSATATIDGGYSMVPLPEIANPTIIGTPVVSTIMNNALVHNPNESNPCKTDGSMPAGDESACTKDPKNVDPAYIVVTSPGVPLLTIRKFAKGIDSQTQSGQVVVGSGEVYPYTFIVTNSGTAIALGARVIDTLPAGIEIIGTPTGTGWACTMSGQTMDCMYDTPIAIGATTPTITAQARIRATVAAGTSIRNVAAVCARDPSKPVTDPANACTPDPVVCKIGDLNYDPVTKQCDPATVVLTGTGFDLSIKKYISTGTGIENDAQIGSGLTLSSGLSMNYVIRVKNEGPQTTTGTTTVRDVLPTGVTASGAATGSGWICTASGASLSCDTTQVVASGSTFTDIIVPVRITAGANTTVTNYAVVYNPDELNPCLINGTMPAGNETACAKDPKNIDPAQFTVPGNNSCGGSNYYIPKCVNGVSSCATEVSCNQPTGSYTTLEACKAVNACGGSGGPSGDPGRCGDGILGWSTTYGQEECDLGTANSNLSTAVCSTQCKLNLWTNPGANPITDLWMTIPALANTKFGSSPFMKTSFSSGVVIGKNGKVFTLADTVGFGIKTQYQIPLMIEADKKICLDGDGNIDDTMICTTFGEAMAMSSNSNVEIFTKLPGTPYEKKYIILGKWDYQYQKTVNGGYSGETSRSANDIDLFRGPVLYKTSEGNVGPTLNSAYHGSAIGEGKVSLVSCSGTDCSSTATVILARLPVRVSSAMVGTTGTPVNRSIASFVNTNSATILAQFGIGNVSGTTTTSTTTTSQATNTLGNVSLNGVTIVTKSVDKISDIPALNGNQAIRAIKGDLTIMCPQFGPQVFALVGVTTVIVEGNIRINCNTAYPSGDTTSSVAWIAKGGNITIDASVTNIAGVYVAIPATAGDTTTTGQFQGTSATNTILKIDGSLYGNANPLFTTRLYARGTSAYDILTTGTIITYSNRALVNPPPLLSQYLGNYSVERVVK